MSPPKAIVFAVATAISLLSFHGGASAQSSAKQFYAGKQVKLITHVGPASGYSAWARLVGAHLGRNIPGAPSIIVQNMRARAASRPPIIFIRSRPRMGSSSVP